MNLLSVKKGYYKIVKINTANSSFVRLTHLGLYIGEIVEKLNDNSSTPVLLNVKGSQITISQKLSEQIHVKNAN